MKRSLMLASILTMVFFSFAQAVEAKHMVGRAAQSTTHFVLHWFLLVPGRCAHELGGDVLKRIEIWDKQTQPPTAEQLKDLA